MKGSMITRAVATSLIATGCLLAAACDQGVNAGAPELASVVGVTPISETISTPRQVCNDVEVQHRSEPKDSHEIAGTAIGAVVGGLAGNQVGGGSGKKIATVAGAIAGGYAGKQIQEAQQEPTVTTTTEQRCKTVTDKRSKVVGYDVAYQYNGSIHHTRMEQRPGETIQVREGVVVVNSNGTE